MPVKVIGAGLGRTGTVSLKIALEQLGIGRCYHMTELITHPSHIGLWQAVLDGRPDWDALLEGYGATADYPICLYWRELAQHFPSAKVILTVRDPDQWFDSTQATIFSRQNMQETQAATPIAAVLQRLRTYHPQLHDRAAMVADFNHHRQAVIDGLPADRLLIYDVAQGWEPLCRFLGAPVPATAFPRANVRADMQALLAQARNPDGTMNEERMRQLLSGLLTRSGKAEG